MKKSISIIIGIVVLAAIGAVIAGYRHFVSPHGTSFITDTITRGDLLVAISSTGTLQPEEVIDVGAQVAGRILSFGTGRNGRPVDYGSFIAKGAVLARIDDSLYRAEVASAKAQSAAAEGSLQRAKADLVQFAAKLYQARRDWQRAQNLGPSEALSATSYDAYRAAYETAKASVAVGQAAVSQAGATLAQASAELHRTEQNLSYCTIVSPVEGVVIDRRVNIGQTVVASLNAPSLFLIAKDLARMQVWVAVNEADIGRVHPGQPVSFTVDAFPGKNFVGTVGKVRLNASMAQNVVTYTVEVITDNKDQQLLPYLTANVQFELERYQDVLMVPNRGLRWTPRQEQISPEFRTTSDLGPSANSRLWVPDGNYVRPVAVATAASDGFMTVVTGDSLRAGMQVVTGAEPAAGLDASQNPFTPQLLRGK